MKKDSRGNRKPKNFPKCCLFFGKIYARMEDFDKSIQPMKDEGDEGLRTKEFGETAEMSFNYLVLF